MNVPLTLRGIETAPALEELPYRAAELLAWANDSTLVLADQDEGQLVFQSSRTAESRRVGRKGSGPGEFMMPSQALTDAAGRLLVFDGKLMRLSVLGPDGEHQTTRAGLGFPQTLLHWDGSRVRGVWTQFSGSATLETVDLETGETVSTANLGERVGETPESGSIQTSFVAAAPLPEGRSVIGDALSYRLWILDTENNVVQRFGRPELEREPRSAEEADELRATMEQGARQAGVAANEQVEQMIQHTMSQPRPYFIARGLVADGDGRIWVPAQRGDRDSTEVDLFSPEGEFLGTVPMRDEVIRLAVRGSRVAALVRRHGGECDGCHGVDVYEIEG